MVARKRMSSDVSTIVGSDVSACLAAERRHRFFDVGDDGVLAAALKEPDGRLDLRTHAAGRELPRCLQSLDFAQRDMIEPALGRLAEVSRHFRHGSEDHQMTDAQHVGHVCAGEILVDHCGNAGANALGPAHDRNAATAAGDHHRAAPRQNLDQGDVDDMARPGRGHHVAPAAARVLAHQPAEFGADAFRLLLGEERPDRLGGVGEGRIVGVDLHLRQHAGDVALAIGLAQRILQRLHQ